MTVSIDGKTYQKMKDAVYAAENGQTIKLDGNLTEDVEIYGNKKVILDLNNFKLDNAAGPTIRIMKHSSLKVLDSSREGMGSVDSTVAGQPAVQVDAGALFIMESGKLTRSAEGPDNMGYVLNNLGTTSLGGTVNVTSTSTSLAAIKTGFDLSVPSEKQAYLAESADYSSSLSINGGVYTGVPGVIVNDEFSKLNIVKGTLNSQNSCIYNLGVCNIVGGSITSSAKSVTESGRLTNVDGGSVFVSGGELNAVSTQPIFAKIVHDQVKAPNNPVVTGGMYSSVAPEYFPPEYLAPGYAFGGAGGLQVIYIAWTVHDAGVSGVGFTGHRKLIISKDKYKYASGGIKVPVVISNAVLIAVNVKGGAVGYYDSTKGMVVLYRGGKEISNETSLEDLTLIFLEI